jgi:hypothetical protein
MMIRAGANSLARRWSGRAVRSNKRGAIEGRVPPTIERQKSIAMCGNKRCRFAATYSVGHFGLLLRGIRVGNH